MNKTTTLAEINSKHFQLAKEQTAITVRGAIVFNSTSGHGTEISIGLRTIDDKNAPCVLELKLLRSEMKSKAKQMQFECTKTLKQLGAVVVAKGKLETPLTTQATPVLKVTELDLISRGEFSNHSASGTLGYFDGYMQ